ncbi:MAG TPA: hypothetical protein VI953_03790, partial [Candidatus Paceibacterota bacterium]
MLHPRYFTSLTACMRTFGRCGFVVYDICEPFYARSVAKVLRLYAGLTHFIYYDTLPRGTMATVVYLARQRRIAMSNYWDLTRRRGTGSRPVLSMDELRKADEVAKANREADRIRREKIAQGRAILASIVGGLDTEAHATT